MNAFARRTCAHKIIISINKLIKARERTGGGAGLRDTQTHYNHMAINPYLTYLLCCLRNRTQICLLIYLKVYNHFLFMCTEKNLFIII